jgi:hypothetical protein
MPGRRPRPRHRQDHRSGRRAWARRALRCAGVRACGCERGTRRYCRAHYQRLLDRRRDDPGFDERRWHRIEPAIEQPGQVSLHGIPVLVSVRLRYGLQRRTRDGAITDAARLRQIAGELRRRQPVSREQVDGRGDQYKVLRCFVRHVQRAVLDPETERVKDVWDLAAFGLRGNLSFTKITQGWLREAAKRWAADDLPRRRGKDTAGPVRHYLLSLAALSESLRANRPDRGEHPGVLGRGDIEAFPRRLAFLAAEARVSVDARTRICREVRHVLTRMRALGLTPRPAGRRAGRRFHPHRRRRPHQARRSRAKPRPAGRDHAAAVCTATDPRQRHLLPGDPPRGGAIDRHRPAAGRDLRAALGLPGLRPGPKPGAGL